MAMLNKYGGRSKPLADQSTNSGGIFDLPRLTSELQNLERETAHPDFWKDPRAAARVSRKKAALERELRRWTEIERQHADLHAMVELAEESGDAGLERELTAELERVEASVHQLRIQLLLSGDVDGRIDIHR